MTTEELSNKIVNTLKELGSATAAELAATTGTAVVTVRELMARVMEEDSSIRCIRGKGYVYEENSGRNSEGYKDLTPYLAMLNDEISESRFTDGAVYDKPTGFSGVVGEPGFALIVRAYKGTVTYLEVWETSFKYFDQANAYVFSNNGKDYYVDPRRVKTTSDKSLGSCQFYILMDDFVAIKREIVRRLRLDDSAALNQMTQADAIQLLKSNGWLKSHDDAIAQAVSSSPVSTNTDYEMVKRERDIWREAFFASCGKVVS